MTANKKALELAKEIGAFTKRLEELARSVVGDSPEVRAIGDHAKKLEALALDVADVPAQIRFRLEMPNRRYVGEGELKTSDPPDVIYWGSRRFDRDGSFDKEAYQHVYVESHSTDHPEKFVRLNIHDVRRLTAPAWKGRE